MKPGTKRPFPEPLFPTLSSQRPGEQEPKNDCTRVEKKTNLAWAFEVAPTESISRNDYDRGMKWYPSFEKARVWWFLWLRPLGLLPSSDFISQVREDSDTHQDHDYNYIIREFLPQLSAGWTSPSYSPWELSLAWASSRPSSQRVRLPQVGLATLQHLQMQVKHITVSYCLWEDLHVDTTYILFIILLHSFSALLNFSKHIVFLRIGK